jgi:N-acyl-D-aspartate/D-glutamate deacylase
LNEFRRLNRTLRKRGAILQSAPNLVTKINVALFLLESAGLFGRALRTTLITLADPKANPGLNRLVGFVTSLFNRVLGANLRWQNLPVPFEVYSDGMDLVVFEEFPSGEAALHLAQAKARTELLLDPAYRKRFRQDYEKRWSPRVWHRDFHDSQIVACPDASTVGKSIGTVADERKQHPADTFLDLVATHGAAFRWRMTIANHRPKERAWMMKQPAALIGFSDAGAHLRNMAFYSFSLRMLRFVKDQQVMPMERAVWRLTGEIADWLGLDAGKLRIGDRADLVVIDPSALDDRLETYHEAPLPELGLTRMVNRSDGAVKTVLVNGRVAFDENGMVSAVGKTRGFGQFLAAKR